MRSRTKSPTPRTLALTAIVLSFTLLVLSLSLAAPGWALGGWTRVPYDSAVFGSTGNTLMFDVGSSPTGFVAVGTDSGTNGATIWVSSDGDTWSRVPTQPDFNLGLALGVTEGPSDMVAVGYVDTPIGDDATVWTGSGMTWVRIPVNPAVLGGSGDQLMEDVCAGGPGVVVVGLDNADAAAWSSPDGTTWTRVPHHASVFSGLDHVAMYGVTAGGPGLVAVGFDDGGGDSDAAVWTSVDGLTWTRVPHVEEALGGRGNQIMYGVTVGENGLLVAVGNDDGIADGVGAVWTSSDGVTWKRVVHDEANLGGPGLQSLEDVAAGGPGFVAVGYEWDFTTRMATAWTSVDGNEWEREPYDPEDFDRSGSEEITAVTIDGYGRVVGVGRHWTGDRLAAAVWRNDTWSTTSGTVVEPSIPVPTDGPHLIDDPRWFEGWGLPMVFAIVVSVLVLGLLVWGLTRGRQSSR